MSKNNAIEICLRVRPTHTPFSGYKLSKQDGKVQFFVQKSQDQGYINNQKQKRVYQYDQVFDMDASQEKIFDKVAKDVVDSAIDGYNGTIFAYGQTGSGKTFTMTGGSESYEDRGIIPRTLSYIFNESQKRAEKISVQISYIQIYNGVGYDLLVPQPKSNKLTDLPKVIPREGANGEVRLENLSPHHATNEEDAMSLLLIGDTTRVVSKTPKNDQSTRSHCIFIIRLQTKKPGSDITSVASIHLVDLSGSERIKETGVEDLLKREAININLGLHFLERVIVCLNKKANGENIHIPYRQSLMTTILRDSIGGNCKTRMIATISAKEEDIMQSISTCKFAMRVALIKNDLERNQTVDPALIIQRLKKQNAQLKAELALIKGGDVKDQLDKYQIQDCHKMVQSYLQSDDPQSNIILTDMLKINQCFYHFKSLFKKNNNSSFANSKPFMNNQSKHKMDQPDNQEGGDRHSEEIKRLKLLVQQRDNEIALILTLINKKKGEGNQFVIPVKRIQEENLMVKSVDKPLMMRQEELMKEVEQRQSKIFNINDKNSDNQSSTEYSGKMSKLQNASEMEEISRMLTKPVNLSSEEMLDHAMAFQQFRKAYRKSQAMKQNQDIKVQKMTQGKELGKILNEIRQKTNNLKVKLEQIKRDNAMNDLVDGKQSNGNQEQEAIRDQLNRLKQMHKGNFEKLKNIKLQVENIDNLQKKNVEALERDFLKWISFKQKQRENMTQKIDSSLLSSGIRDKEVQKHLESFLKARDEIRKK